MSRAKEITGYVSGRLTVVERVENNKDGRAMWRCACSCGNESIVMSKHIVSNHVKSCGCVQREKLVERNTKHSLSNSKVHNTWQHIKGRCYKENTPQFKDYGGRGIKLYEPWVDDFKAFYDYVGEPAGPSLTLDRIDNNKGYEPGNVRWATRKEQSRNTSRNIWVDFHGERMVLKDACLLAGMHPETVRCRMLKGMPFEQAILKGDRRFTRNKEVA